MALLHFSAIGGNANKNYDDSDENPCSCFIGASAVKNTTRKITVKQAKALVWAALTPELLRVPGIAIDLPDKNSGSRSSYEDSYHPRFLIFHVIWAGNSEGSNNVGYYGVDVYTGDVFDAVSGCPEYKSRKLDTLQRKIRHSLNLTQIEYEKLKTNGPMCAD